ncbi:MAG TPA: D-amino-acid transaminase [Gemmatimonadaceae bacterium]|jgi:D-alanine transaminase|nr:D-amino-acid transaminase [Gemmatimonadaceae bacterium]
MDPKDIVYVNGRFLPRAEAHVSVEDRGFVFGDGVYEVIRAINGRLFATRFHNARLERSLEGIRIHLQGDDRPARFVEIGKQLLRENNLQDGEATLYIQVTRGATTRAHYFPPADITPTVYISVARFKPYRELAETGASAISHPDLRWGRCDLKTLNLLPNVLASQTAKEKGAFEAMLVRDGVVTEGAKTNFFGVIDGTLRTHPSDNHILPGITRAVLEDLARGLSIDLDETPIAVSEIHKVKELFLTGTTTDVMPIVRLDDKAVGSGRPGELTRRLQRVLAENLASGGD